MSSEQVPRGWQQVCQRAKMPAGSSTPCSLYLSPNGRTFRTMEEVQEYNRQLEKQKIEREQKKMEKGRQQTMKITGLASSTIDEAKKWANSDPTSKILPHSTVRIL